MVITKPPTRAKIASPVFSGFLLGRGILGSSLIFHYVEVRFFGTGQSIEVIDPS